MEKPNTQSRGSLKPLRLNLKNDGFRGKDYKGASTRLKLNPNVRTVVSIVCTGFLASENHSLHSSFTKIFHRFEYSDAFITGCVLPGPQVSTGFYEVLNFIVSRVVLVSKPIEYNILGNALLWDCPSQDRVMFVDQRIPSKCPFHEVANTISIGIVVVAIKKTGNLIIQNSAKLWF